MGHGCITLFASVFVLAGIAVMYLSYRGWVDPSTYEGDLWVGFVVGALFVVVGAGLIIGSSRAVEAANREATKIASEPDRPWLWKPKWTAHQIQGSAKREMISLWAFCILWNSITSVSTYFAIREFIDAQNRLALVALVFPAVGLVLLYAAVRTTARYLKFGSSTLNLEAAPIPLGGQLAGSIEAGFKHAPEQGVGLTLSAVEVRSGDRNSSERVLWQDESHVRRGEISRHPPGVSIPVRFDIPTDSPETHHGTVGRARVEWRLEAIAPVAGVDYQTRFEVGVFDTGEAPLKTKEAPAKWTFASDRPEPFNSKDRTFIKRPSPLGGVEYFFPAARNKGAAAGLTVFLAIWLGTTWLFFYFGSWLFTALFGLFAILLAIFSAGLWFETTLIRVEGGELTVRRKTLGFGSTKKLACSEIADVSTSIGMQQSKTMTQTSHVWYDVSARPNNGQPFTIVGGIANKREAEWFANELLEQIVTSV